VTGRRSAVEDAKTRIVQDFQTKLFREVRIPKDHHRVIIGRSGTRLQEMEKETSCKITVPGRENPSDIIVIRGPKDGIEKALHKIHIISDEQSRLAQETLLVPKIFYPWIRGPYDRVMNKLMEETKARINIPPRAANSEIIVVTGEKEGVYKAAAVIRQIFEEKKALVKSVTCKVAKDQHRFVIGAQGSGLSDILEETGVSVEVPPEVENSDTITLRGDPARLGEALSMVYKKASSHVCTEVECPQWLHKFIIGQNGANIKRIVGDQSKISVNFEEGRIFIEGAPEEVKPTEVALTELTATLKQEMGFEVLHISPIYHPHVIGRSGANISKIKHETGVSVIIPDQNTNSDEIRIEGKKEGVKKAAKEISEIAKRLENEKSKDIIIEQRFHKMIIGPRGDRIRELRDKFPGVMVSFPEPGCRSNAVSLRGPKDEVEKLAKHLNATVKELLENNFQIKVPIFKEFHKVIIGKNGANIRKIREETETKIDLPSESSGEDAISVTGKKANVEKAVAQLHAIQNELASIVTIEMSIPQKIHVRLIGNGGRLIQDISEQCGGVQIKFPPEKAHSDKVLLRGPREETEKAQKLLADLAKDKELSSHQESVKARPELFRFLIGRGGNKIKKVRDANPDVRILFPRPADQDQETIHIIGRKEEVAKTKTQLEGLIAELKEIEEITLDVAEKWHRHFVFRGAALLKEIQDQCGGVIISFPKANTNSTTVSVKGAKDCVQAAKKRILEIVSDLEAQVTISVEIPAEHHQALLSQGGAKIKRLTSEHNVQIKFPDRGPPRHMAAAAAAQHGDGQVLTNGDSVATQNGDGPRPQDLVHITGRPENCEACKNELLAQVPVPQTMHVPFDFHSTIIGKAGLEIRRLQDDYDVTINIPSRNEKSDEIVVSGAPKNVEDAIADIQTTVDKLNEQIKDRELRNFFLRVQIPPEYHTRIVGPVGSVVNGLRNKYSVEIRIPGGAPRPKFNNPRPIHVAEIAEDEILISGYEADAEKCKAEIEKIVEDIRSQFVQEITIDARIHNRLIGKRGATIRKMMEQFGVEIHFPRQGDRDPNLVSVSGNNEDAVYDAVDELRNLEEEYLQDITEMYIPPKPKNQEYSAPQQVQEVEVKGAPWNPTSDGGSMNDHFPSLGGGSDAPNGAAGGGGIKMGAWGARR
jgi:polyribonucleotide nucleotidyltransferase